MFQSSSMIICVSLSFWNPFLQQPLLFYSSSSGHSCIPFCRLIFIHPPKRWGTSKSLGSRQLFSLTLCIFLRKITSTTLIIIYTRIIPSPIFISLIQDYSLRFISLFSTSYPTFPFGSLKLSIFKSSIYKKQGFDLSPKIWFYFCFPILVTLTELRALLEPFSLNHSHPVHHKVPLI